MGISISETPHSTLAVNFIFSSMNFNAYGRLVGGGDISISERLSYRNHYMCSGEATSYYIKVLSPPKWLNQLSRNKLVCK